MKSSGVTVILSENQLYNAVTPREPRTTPQTLVNGTKITETLQQHPMVFIFGKDIFSLF